MGRAPQYVAQGRLFFQTGCLLSRRAVMPRKEGMPPPSSRAKRLKRAKPFVFLDESSLEYSPAAGGVFCRMSPVC